MIEADEYHEEPEKFITETSQNAFDNVMTEDNYDYFDSDDKDFYV